MARFTVDDLSPEQFAVRLAEIRGAQVVGPLGRWHRAFRLVLGFHVETNNEGAVRNRWVVLARYRGEGAHAVMLDDSSLFRSHAARRGFRARTRSFIETGDDGPEWVLCARMNAPSPEGNDSSQPVRQR